MVCETPEHPFWIKDHGWLKAALLESGMVLLDRDDQVLEVVSQTKLARLDRVYNIEVEELHIYHVGTLGTWVHNACCNIKDGKFIFNNLLPSDLTEELAVANRLGVRPLSVSSDGFSNVASSGTLKYAVLEDGSLLFVPKYVGANEIKHSVIANGKSVLAAGEVEVYSLGNGKFASDVPNVRSGHYMNGATAVQNTVAKQVALEAFARHGIVLLK